MNKFDEFLPQGTQGFSQRNTSNYCLYKHKFNNVI